VVFATAAPAYLDKTNATAIHAALGLDPAAAAYDAGGAVRSGMGALRLALAGGGPTLVALADVRTGLPGGTDEREGGDGAVAFLVGDGSESLAELVAWASSSGEFLDRWQLPGEPTSHQWEERFGEHAYVPLAEAAITEVLKDAGVEAAGLDHVIVAGVHPRAARRIAAGIGARAEAYADDLTLTVGNAGTAHAGLVLASVLDRAEPDQTILLVNLADGADVAILRTTAALPARRAAPSVEAQIAEGKSLPYPTFLTWRGQLDREPPRRPDPEAPAAPPSYRHEGWKFAFEAARCEDCGTRHLPPARVCLQCHAVDRMAPERLADVGATVATFSIDRLAFSPSPPMVAAVIDFDGGGRYRSEITDADPDALAIGNRVVMTFRRLGTAKGIHNYGWKARPLRAGEEI
jgi:3-hydroxy-3-methylglutaryl CoA synthase/uncharacterized OB-fold protein